MRVNKRTFAAAIVVPKTLLTPIDLPAVFGRTARFEVDLGCGDGSLLAALAEQAPQTNFLGIEHLIGRVRGASRKIEDRRLTNARILPEDILYSVQQLLPPASVDVFHLMFPDPWPKRRHYDRRIVNESFLRAIERALKPGGELRIATDHGAYFAAMQVEVRKARGLTLITDVRSANGAATTFEKHFRTSGVAIHRVVLRKVSARK
jgi:tRNA (guanine-N7-)-methyltransferase